MHRTKYFSVIRSPGELGGDMNFEPKGMSLPVYNARSLPNYPNFRLYDIPGAICDTLTATSEAAYWRNQTWVQINPNPANDYVEINSTPAPRQPRQLRVYSADGRLVLDRSHPEHERLYRLDVSAMIPGVYSLEMILDDQSRVWKKLVISH